MPRKILPEEKWGTSQEIERWLREERDKELGDKLNAIRLLLKGYRRKEVAEIIGVSEATVKNWRRRWNEGGKESLRARYAGSKSKVSEDIRIEIEDIIVIKREIDGRTVTGKLIHGYLKKNTG
jgi:transposase